MHQHLVTELLKIPRIILIQWACLSDYIPLYQSACWYCLDICRRGGRTKFTKKEHEKTFAALQNKRTWQTQVTWANSYRWIMRSRPIQLRNLELAQQVLQREHRSIVYQTRCHFYKACVVLLDLISPVLYSELDVACSSLLADIQTNLKYFQTNFRKCDNRIWIRLNETIPCN